MNNKGVENYVNTMVKDMMLDTLTCFGYNECKLTRTGLIDDFKSECYIIKQTILKDIDKHTMPEILQLIEYASIDFVNSYIRDTLIMNEINKAILIKERK